jgi:putative phage-type endonuclease
MRGTAGKAMRGTIADTTGGGDFMAIQHECAYEIVCSSDNESAWLRARNSGLGASEAAAVCGESTWDSPYALYSRKIGVLAEKDETEPMRWGKLLEPVILGEYRCRTGRGARRHGLLIRSVDHPWALATLDGETWLPDNDAKQWPLEIKNSSAFSASEWAEGPPRPYYLQVQQQMLVMGTNRATTACLLGGNRLVWADVERDEIAINKIITRGEEMWRRIQNMEPPPVDDSEATSDALRQIYPKDDGSTCMLPAELIDVADELEAQKEVEKSAKGRIDELKNRIIAGIGSATRGILPDGRGFTYGWQERAGYVVQPTSFRVLRAINRKSDR